MAAPDAHGDGRVADHAETAGNRRDTGGGRDIADGLKLLGTRSDTDTSVFHEWSSALPTGTFDAYRSVVPAP